MSSTGADYVHKDLPNWVFTVFGFLSFVMVSIPLPWHFYAWNTGTCLYMFWCGSVCFIYSVNSIVWNDNTLWRVPVWCDIATKLIIGASVGIPASSLCINRRLYKIASVQTVMTTKTEKRQAVMADLSIGVGIPVLVMILHVIVQGHRFDIFEELGCMPRTYPSVAAFFCVFAWPLAISLVSAVYSALTILTFARRRIDFKKFLSGSEDMNRSRYYRLMALAGVELFCGIPLSTYILYINLTTGPLYPYISWYNVHQHFDRADMFPSVIWKLSKLNVAVLELDRWNNVICAFLFFAFFGFADEARKHYKLAINSVAKRMGLQSFLGSNGSDTNGYGNSGSNPSRFGKNMPVFITSFQQRQKRSVKSTLSSDRYSNTSLSFADYEVFDGAKEKDKETETDVETETAYESPTSTSSSSSPSSLRNSPGGSHITLEMPTVLEEPQPVFDPSNVPRHVPDAPSSLQTMQLDAYEEV